jgi:hypothetical protein
MFVFRVNNYTRNIFFFPKDAMKIQPPTRPRKKQINCTQAQIDQKMTTKRKEKRNAR